MRRSTIAVALVALALLGIGCAELPFNDPGCIAMQPFVDVEQGIRGLTVTGGQLAENAFLIQNYIPSTWDEIMAEYQRQTGNAELPEPNDTYRGRLVEFTIYELETKLEGGGPYFYKVHAAFGEVDGAYYQVLLIARPSDYAKNKVRYVKAFESAMYAFQPIPREGG